jgi:hypothetical protein
MSNIIKLAPTTSTTAKQALQEMLEDNDLTEVIIIGIDSTDDLVIRSSGMTRRDALWLIEQAKIHTLEA